MSGQYEDIIHLSYPVPSMRQRMSMIDRAAQFSPFAALVGYDDAIGETSRLTDRRIELDENEKYMLDLKQNYLQSLLPQMPLITVTYFSPDDRKEGGEYVTVTGRLKSILHHEDVMILSDCSRICLKDVVYLDSPALQNEI